MSPSNDLSPDRAHETDVFLDAVQRFVWGVVGPDDMPAEVHLRTQPFSLTVTTDRGIQLNVRTLPNQN